MLAVKEGMTVHTSSDKGSQTLLSFDSAGPPFSIDMDEEDTFLQEYNRRIQDEGDDGIPNVILFVFCFFTIWNMIICIHTVKACSGVVRGEFNESAPTLFCPHWIVGIAVPMYVGYSWYGIGGLFFCMIPFIVPHAVGIFCLKYRSQQPQATNASNDQNENPSAQVEEVDSPDLRGMTEGDRIEYLDKVLITKKVITGQSIGGTTNDDSASFRTRNPKSDIILAEITGKSMVDQVLSAVSGANDEKSVKMCSICLDEYQVDEEICYSQNPECSHVFHKKCLVDWLLTDASCPNCRHSYIGDFSQNDPEP